jgi:hypothetical protein
MFGHKACARLVFYPNRPPHQSVVLAVPGFVVVEPDVRRTVVRLEVVGGIVVGGVVVVVVGGAVVVSPKFVHSGRVE